MIRPSPKWVILIGLFLAVACNCPAEQPASSGKPESSAPAAEGIDTGSVKIGIYLPMTGPLAAGGQMVLDGIKLAQAQRPRVLDRVVDYVLVDNKSDKVESANAVSRLIENDKVSAVIGAYASSNSIAGSEICNRAGVPMLTPASTNPIVTAGKHFIFRTCFIDPFQGEVMARYAIDKLGARTAMIIQDVAADYSVGLASFFERAFKKLTGDENSILGKISYQTGDQDFTAQLTTSRTRNPDVIFIPGYFGDIALFARQAKELGIAARILAGDGAQAPELIEIGGDAVEGLVFSNHYAPESSTEGIGKHFVDTFTQSYTQVPNAFAALGYDSYNIVLDAIAACGKTDPECIRQQLAAMKDYPAVTGIITMDANGDAVKNAVILEVRNGKFAYLDTISP